MSRLKETNDTLEKLLKDDVDGKTFNSMMLMEIAKSLAVIADEVRKKNDPFPF